MSNIRSILLFDNFHEMKDFIFFKKIKALVEDTLLFFLNFYSVLLILLLYQIYFINIYFSNILVEHFLNLRFKLLLLFYLYL